MSLFEIETPVAEIINRTYNVKSFRFKKPEDASYKPGQYLFVTLNSGGEEITKSLSISSSPTEKEFLEFTKKLTGSAFSHALDNITKGSRIKVRFPLGNFTFTGEYKKIAFLSGGIGITPIRSIIKYATDMNLSSSIVLIDSNNKIEDVVFKDELDFMQAKNRDLRIIYTLTDLSADRQDLNCDLSNWRGCKGYITKDMIKMNIPDYPERKFYLCGPPMMVEAMSDILFNELTLKRGDVISENFYGY